MISKGDASKGITVLVGVRESNVAIPVLPRLSLTTFLFVCPLEF